MIDLQRLKKLDSALLNQLKKQSPSAQRRGEFRNPQLAKLAFKDCDSDSAETLWRLLNSKRAVHLNYSITNWRDKDGERSKLTILRAAATDMWPMGTNYWVRDNAIIGARLLNWRGGKEEKRYSALGKQILLSCLTIMSASSQLRRFEAIIRSASKKFRNDPHNWPQIFLGIDKNLHGVKLDPWSHKQDAWQILAWYTLTAIREGKITIKSLTAKQRRFLGLVVPFLLKTDHLTQENSGSWEEIPSVRSSVIVWEARLIDLVGELSRMSGFAFLNEGYEWAKPYLAKRYRKMSLSDLCNEMTINACRFLKDALPDESPNYKRKDPRYRQADAALIYALQLDIPEFLADRLSLDQKWARQMEKKILRAVETLTDRRTGGIRRYLNDSYQRSGFFRYVTVAKLVEMYGAPSGDSSSHFTGRDKIVPKGREAAWVHFVWQLSAWAGRRFLSTGEIAYKKMQWRFFRQALRLVTGDKEGSIKQGKEDSLEIIDIPGFRIPEAYISDRIPAGPDLVFPSPHTPLNWAVAEAIDAFGVMKEVNRLG